MEHNQTNQPTVESALQTLKDVAGEQGPTPLDSFRVLFKRSWKFFSEHFFSLTSFFFLLSFIPALVGILLEIVGFRALTLFENRFGFLLFSGFLSLVGLVVTVVFQVVKLGAIKKVQDTFVSQEESHIVSAKKIVKFAWPLIAVWVISMAAVLGGSFLLIVPGVLVGISIMFAAPFVVLENKKIGDALLSSFWLVNGRRWQVFAQYLLCGLVFLGALVVLFAFLATLAILAMNTWFGGVEYGLQLIVGFVLTGALEHTAAYYMFALLWSTVIALVLAPFWTLFMVFDFFVWQNLKAVVTTSATERFNKKSKKLLMVFSIIAVVGVITMIVFGIMFGDPELSNDGGDFRFPNETSLTQ